MKPYEEFLEEKVAFDEAFGFDVRDVDLHRVLKPHQRDIVRWAVKGGRRAIFAAFGMGKSVMQLETLRLILDRDGQSGRALIVCPLGVRIEFAHDAEMLDIATRFVRRTEEVGGPGIYVTNYESVRDGRLDVGLRRFSNPGDLVHDPFAGVGTVPLVAKALGRHGISNDMSADYCRLAEWRTTDPKQLAKAARRPFVPPAEQTEGQLDLLEGIA